MLLSSSGRYMCLAIVASGRSAARHAPVFLREAKGRFVKQVHVLARRRHARVFQAKLIELVQEVMELQAAPRISLDETADACAILPVVQQAPRVARTWRKQLRVI